MPATIYASTTASITELKRNPSRVVECGGGEAVAILNRNTPEFYCVPTTLYERLMEQIEDSELTRIAKAREKEEEISVDISQYL